MDYQNPVVVIPGITATELLDDYPLKTRDLWTMVMHKDYERIALHPDDLRYEAIEPAHVFSGRAFSIYNDLIRALRHELSSQADKPTPVFAYPYDWRMDIRQTAAALGVFVEEVIARTRLLKHYAGARDIRVDLVGHSMGGLVILEYLNQSGNDAPVGKVVTMGTPFKGAVEAIVKIATGMSLLAGSEPEEYEREAARVTPSVYQLFPSYRGAARWEDGKQIDLFDPGNIQASILDSLIEYVRLYSVDVRSEQRKSKAEEILRKLLSNGREHRETVEAFSPAMLKNKTRDWLAIVGFDQQTRIAITVGREYGRIRYVLTDDQFVNNPTSSAIPRQTGDGTVPLDSAVPPFMDENQVVCVKKGDLGRFELRDRLFTEVAGFHGLLPSVNLVQRLAVKHLRPSYRGKVWGRPVFSVDNWNPPIENLQRR